MPLNEYPVWTEGVTLPRGDAGSLPATADLVVVGGGISGLAAAREVARRGARVVLIEARTLGWGASSRNGGMVLTGLKLDAGTLIRRYGMETAGRMFGASLQAIDMVEQIVAEEQIDCDFNRCGHLVVASKPAHQAALVEEAELLERAFGHRTHVVPRERLSEEIGSTSFYGGMVDPRSAGLNPARYVAGLVRAAQRAGAHLVERTPVVALRRQGPGWEIETSRGSMRADQILVATGGYTDSAAPNVREKVIPIGSYIIATESLTADLAAALSPRGRMIYDTRHFLYYFRLTPDRRMLFGGRASFFPETRATVRASADILRRGMVGVFPQLRDARVEYAWGGTVDFTFDMMPHAGVQAGSAYAVGYAGHGVALATYLGTQIGASMVDHTVERVFDQPLPGAPLGLYDGRPWFLPFAGLWYKILDWIS